MGYLEKGMTMYWGISGDLLKRSSNLRKGQGISRSPNLDSQILSKVLTVMAKKNH